MSTNYYLFTDVCKCCGRPDNKLHIGKSSSGWVFSLHVAHDEHDDETPKDLMGWVELWNRPGNIIRNEYWEDVKPGDMLDIITDRSGKGKAARMAYYNNPNNKSIWNPYGSYQAFMDANHAEEGPNGLLRGTYKSTAPEDGGTYSLCAYEFS